MKWIDLTSEQQLAEIRTLSNTKAQVIFKHSTRCGISSMAKSRLDRSGTIEAVDFYFLDLIRYRHLSDLVASEFSVYHESPQVLLIRNGECIYDESHSGIQMEDILLQAS